MPGERGKNLVRTFRIKSVVLSWMQLLQPFVPQGIWIRSVNMLQQEAKNDALHQV